eukprot:322414-Pyramimonas_sp.AAC.1
MLLEALSVDSKHSNPWKKLYEVPGGDQVDGSPPAPVEELEEFGRGVHIRIVRVILRGAVDLRT